MPPPIPTSDELAKMSKLFSLLDEEARGRMLAGATRRLVPEGQVIFREGEPGEEFFLILAGRVSVVADDLGTSKTIAELGRSAFFGEMAMVARQPRSATVTALEACDLLAFGRATLDAVLKDHPTVRQAMGVLSVRRIEELMEKLST